MASAPLTASRPAWSSRCRSPDREHESHAIRGSTWDASGLVAREMEPLSSSRLGIFTRPGGEIYERQRTIVRGSPCDVAGLRPASLIGLTLAARDSQASSRRGRYADCGASCCRRRPARPCRVLRRRVWTGAACLALGPEGPHGYAGCRPRLADAPRRHGIADKPRPRPRALWPARADCVAGAVAGRPCQALAHGRRSLPLQLPGVSRSRGPRRTARDQVGGRPGARRAARRASRADEGAAPASWRGGGTRRPSAFVRNC